MYTLGGKGGVFLGGNFSAEPSCKHTGLGVVFLALALALALGVYVRIPFVYSCIFVLKDFRLCSFICLFLFLPVYYKYYDTKDLPGKGGGFGFLNSPYSTDHMIFNQSSLTKVFTK